MTDARPVTQQKVTYEKVQYSKTQIYVVQKYTEIWLYTWVVTK